MFYADFYLLNEKYNSPTFKVIIDDQPAILLITFFLCTICLLFSVPLVLIFLFKKVLFQSCHFNSFYIYFLKNKNIYGEFCVCIQ